MKINSLYVKPEAINLLYECIQVQKCIGSVVHAQASKDLHRQKCVEIIASEL